MEPIFDYEKLDAYQAALDFAPWVGTVVERLPARLSARDRLDRASTGSGLNIAEGNGKFALRDRRRYFDIALGSEMKCAGAIDVIVIREFLSIEESLVGKRKLHRAVSTLVGLIRSVEKRLGEGESPPSRYN